MAAPGPRNDKSSNCNENHSEPFDLQPNRVLTPENQKKTYKVTRLSEIVGFRTINRSFQSSTWKRFELQRKPTPGPRSSLFPLPITLWSPEKRFIYAVDFLEGASGEEIDSMSNTEPRPRVHFRYHTHSDKKPPCVRHTSPTNYSTSKIGWRWFVTARMFDTKKAQIVTTKERVSLAKEKKTKCKPYTAFYDGWVHRWHCGPYEDTKNDAQIMRDQSQVNERFLCRGLRATIFRSKLNIFAQTRET